MIIRINNFHFAEADLHQNFHLEEALFFKIILNSNFNMRVEQDKTAPEVGTRAVFRAKNSEIASMGSEKNAISRSAMDLFLKAQY